MNFFGREIVVPSYFIWFRLINDQGCDKMSNNIHSSQSVSIHKFTSGQVQMGFDWNKDVLGSSSGMMALILLENYKLCTRTCEHMFHIVCHHQQYSRCTI